MSVNGMNQVAVQRDLGQPQRAAEPDEPGKLEDTQAQGYADLLITAIPTEPLALYTFVIGGIVATTADGGDQRLTMRWIIFGAAATFIALWMLVSYRRKVSQDKKADRTLPLPELLAAVVAFGAWGLAMPESPLMAELSSSDRTIWTVIIVASGVALLGLLTGTLKKPSKSAQAKASEQSGGGSRDPAPNANGSGSNGDGFAAALGAALVAGAEAWNSHRAGKAGTTKAGTGGAGSGA